MQMLVPPNRTSNAIQEVSNETAQLFIGMLTHELRTQIAGICTASSILLEKDCTDKGFYLSCINSLSLNVLQVLNNMMASATLGCETLEIKPIITSIQLRKWLRSHIEQYETITASRSIKIKLLVRCKVPEYVNTDAVKLGQILRNLVDNALKAAPQGTNITLSVNVVEEGRILFEVIDHGEGIPADKVPLLFKPFQLLDLGYAGTGLGLYISKVYAELLGGDIKLVDTTKRGTTFLLSIKNQAHA
jgi:signal transduction histidine kinase